MRRTVEDACPYKFVGRILWVALQVSFFRSHCGFRSGLRFVIGFMVCRSVCDLWYEAFRRMCVRWLSAYGSCDLRLTAARYRPVIFLRSDADTCRDRRPDCPNQTNAIPARRSYPPSDARTLSAVFSAKSHLPPATRRSEPSQTPKKPAGSSPRASQIIYHCRCIYNYKYNANIS